MSTVYFNELDTSDLFVDEIERIFEQEEVIKDLDCSVTIYSEFDDKVSNLSLPCILISITSPSTEERYSTFDNRQFATRFTLSCEIYSNNISKYSRKRAVTRIGDILNEYLTSKYNNFSVSSTSLPNIDTNIARKLYRFSGTLENKNNYLYS